METVVADKLDGSMRKQASKRPTLFHRNMQSFKFPPVSLSNATAALGENFASKSQNASDCSTQMFNPSCNLHKPNTRGGSVSSNQLVASNCPENFSAPNRPPLAPLTNTNVMATVTQAALQEQKENLPPPTSGKKVPWTPAEEDKLRQAMQDNPKATWKSIAALLAPRTDKQCREKWVNEIDPCIDKSPWSSQEYDKLRSLIKEQMSLGGDLSWAKIARNFKGRTQRSIRYIYIKGRSQQSIKNIYEKQKNLKPRMLDYDLQGASSEVETHGPEVNSLEAALKLISDKTICEWISCDEELWPGLGVGSPRHMRA